MRAGHRAPSVPVSVSGCGEHCGDRHAYDEDCELGDGKRLNPFEDVHAIQRDKLRKLMPLGHGYMPRHGVGLGCAFIKPEDAHKGLRCGRLEHEHEAEEN